MYCSKCGELNSDGAGFCKKCGAPLNQAVVQQDYVPAAPPAAGQQPARTVQPTSGFSIASLVLGIIGFAGIFAVLAIIFGAIGIHRAKTSGAGGKGMAITGLVLGILWIVLWIAFVTIFLIGLSSVTI